MPRTTPGTNPWGDQLNADLDAIEAKADTALENAPLVAALDRPAYATDNAGPFDTLRNAYNWKASNTRKTRAALGRARSGLGLANFLCVGDSATEGKVDATTFAPRSKSWPPEMRAGLAAAGIPAAGDGVVLGGSSTAPYDARVTFVGTWTQSTGYAQSSISGNTITWTFSTPNTHFDIWSSGVSGQFTVKIDGGAVVATVNPTGVSTWVKTTVSTTAGMHTITITKTNATATAIKGINAYSTSGVAVHNVAASGWSAADWNTYTLWYQHVGAVELMFPDAGIDTLFLCLGANDIALQSKTPAQAATSLAQVAARFVGPELILLIEQHSQSIDYAVWSDFCGRVYDLADTLDCPLIDITNRIGTFNEGATNGLYGDVSHLFASGQADWGRNVASLLLA